MITLYHCNAARSFRPALDAEELGPHTISKCCVSAARVRKRLSRHHPLGTIPFMIDGDTADVGIVRHLPLSRHAIRADAAGRQRRRAGLRRGSDWMYFSDAR